MEKGGGTKHNMSCYHCLGKRTPDRHLLYRHNSAVPAPCDAIPNHYDYIQYRRDNGQKRGRPGQRAALEGDLTLSTSGPFASSHQ